MQLQDLNALVTGSTSGIGRAIAERFAAEGANVLVSGRDRERGDAVAAQIAANGGGGAGFLAADLRQRDGWQKLAEGAVERLGTVDVLVNNAGVYHFAPTPELGEDAFDAMFETNVRSLYLLTAALAPAMAERGSGTIVNVSSVAAHVGMAGAAAYGASKAAVELLTKAWAAEFGSSGVRVNAIAPGPVRTPGTEPLSDMIEQVGHAVPAGRTGTSQEMAAAAVFLASEAAAYMHGATLNIDGGAARIMA